MLVGCVRRTAAAVGAVLLAVGLLAGCGKPQEGRLSGTIKMDGSSTVYPITEAVAEEFGKQNASVKTTVGISGTGGGMKKLSAGEIDIADASRPIKGSEVEMCKRGGIEYIELPIAYDALSVVVNPRNTWCSSMTVRELKRLWEPAAQGKITRWSQVRPGWPNSPIRLFGAGVDSGTYDYFTEAVVGKEHTSRGDFTSSEDDNVLVQGVAQDVNALAFFGVAYYEENKQKLKAVAIDDENPANGRGPQLPTRENVEKGTYQPLSRPLFIYVNRKSADRPEVQEFVRFYLANAGRLAEEVGYIALPAEVYKLAQERFDKRIVGSVFGGKGSQVGVKLTDLLKAENG